MLELYRAGKLKLDELVTQPVQAGRHQPGLRRPRRRQEHPRRRDPRALTLLGAIEREVVGLRREAEVITVALQEGCHVVLEGPPGDRQIDAAASDCRRVSGRGIEFVEGNAELTPARLLGHHDPALVLDRRLPPEAWTDGPLATSMRDGSLLYLEELNRIPEETLNVLITAMAEREIVVPRLGRIAAAEGFVLVAAMNPFDAIGTARVSQAIADRMCRVSIGYLDEQGEREVVAGRRRQTGASRRRRRRRRGGDRRQRHAGHPHARRGSRRLIGPRRDRHGSAGARTGTDPRPTSRLTATLCSTRRSPRCRDGSGSTRTRTGASRR